MSDPDPTAEILEIRRYPNRRLYDVTRSKAVTLEELFRLVREGYQIQVTEKSSGENITTRVLTQMILDWDKGKLEMFPAELLHAVLQANERLVGDFVDTHFREALESFTKSREFFESQWKPVMNADLNQGWMKPWVAPFGSQVSGGADPELREMVGELRDQIAAMRSELKEGRSGIPEET